jgi:hypothetical protein
VLLGTPQYMSPEACESRTTLDHRTDIYALGVLLFQMMTGVLPFDGETMGEVLVKQVTQLPPPPRGFNPNIPPSVEQILLRCLMKVPDKRFQTMVALREALLDPENYLHKSPPIAPARSLAPGEAKVDAKTVMAYAAQEQKTRIGFDNPLPLVAPPSMPGASSQATMISDGSLIPPRRAATHGPDMAVPSAPKSNTMRIATPIGYRSTPPKRVWPIVLVVALLLGLGGGAFAVAYFGRKDPGAQLGAAATDAPNVDMTVAKGSAAPAADAAVVTAAPIDAGVAASVGIDARVAVTPIPDKKVAVVVIDSAPQGADVLAPDGTVVGKTPARLSLPVTSRQLTYELRLAGYRKKTKQFVVSGNAVIDVPLERIQQQIIIRHQGSGAKRGSSDDLERP